MVDVGFKYKVYNPYVVAMIAVMGGVKAISAIRQAGITSSMAGGSFLGSLISGPMADWLGRKPILQIASLVWMIGAAIQTSSINIAQLIMGRIIAGFAVGFSSSQVPVYVAEMSPKQLRGMLVGAFQWFTTLGILIMFYVGYGCGKINGPAAFRTSWGIQMIPGFIFFLGTLILEESPRWLAAKGKWDKSIEIIANIQAKGDVNNDTVRLEIEEIKEAVRIEKNSHFKVWHLFRGKTNLRRTFVGLTCQMWQQLTGMNVAMYYITTVFSFAGYSGDSNLVASSIQYIINVVMTIPALLFVDRWGRRRMMYYGSFIMMAWMIAMAAVLGSYSVHLPNGLDGNPQVRIKIPTENKSASKGVIAISYLFVATFAPTWGPAAWIYCSEIFPLEQRAQGTSLCAAVNWAFNLAIGLFTPQAFVNITWRTYIIYAVFCFAMTINVFLMYPETHGLTLEEVSELWESNIPAWKSTNWKPTAVPNIADIHALNGGRAPSIKDKAGVEHLDDVSEIKEEHSI